MDLRTRLEQFGGPVEPASSDTMEADLGRGRHAVRTRRTAQAAAGSAFAIAAIVAGVSTAGHESPRSLVLVDYHGRQPTYFTVDKVPAGFFIQSDDEGGLTIAPDRVKNPGPNVDPSRDPLYDPHDLGGKIGIYLEQKSFHGDVRGDNVAVGGHPAILHPIGTTWQLEMSASPDVYAIVQFDVPLSQSQMIELGAGLHVHREAIDRAAAATGKVPHN